MWEITFAHLQLPDPPGTWEAKNVDQNGFIPYWNQVWGRISIYILPCQSVIDVAPAL